MDMRPRELESVVVLAEFCIVTVYRTTRRKRHVGRGYEPLTHLLYMLADIVISLPLKERDNCVFIIEPFASLKSSIHDV